MIAAPSRVDLLRTRVVLARMRAEQERLGAALQATGLTSFVARSEWLLDHRTPDEKLAWTRYWRRLGVSDPEPRPERFSRPTSLGRRPTPRRKPRRVGPVIPVERQMQIALAALEKAEKAGQRG